MDVFIKIVLVALVMILYAITMWAIHDGDPFLAALGLIILIIVNIVILTRPHDKMSTIKVKSIEQIDTLYRNGDVVGYELTITKYRKEK